MRAVDLDAAHAEAFAGLLATSAPRLVPNRSPGAAVAVEQRDFGHDGLADADRLRGRVAATVRATIGRQLSGTVLEERYEPEVSAAVAALVVLVAAAAIVLVMGVVWPT